jgi:hypothetical protein
MEHFCTLFDKTYLLQGMALFYSLQQHLPGSVLWVLCMDSDTEQTLERLNLEGVRPISLAQIESKEILSIKSTRSKGEYCWTLTPFLPSCIFAHDGSVSRVTYLDADLFLFESPLTIINEMETAEKDVLITDHAYDPQYDQSATSGRFCVQFLTFRRSAKAEKVLRWWQEKCLEWCFARVEPGRFGDQKYLDEWPSLFPETVHIVEAIHKTLAPWNLEFYMKKMDGRIAPTFYHFHYLRVASTSRLRQHFGYKISRPSLNKIYKPYREALTLCKKLLLSRNIQIAVHTLPKENLAILRDFKRRLSRTVSYAPF